MLKNCAANRKRRLSALLILGPYIYTTLKFLALQGAPYIYDISRLRVKTELLCTIHCLKYACNILADYTPDSSVEKVAYVTGLID
jgi:hypothetical protein